MKQSGYTQILLFPNLRMERHMSVSCKEEFAVSVVPVAKSELLWPYISTMCVEEDLP